METFRNLSLHFIVFLLLLIHHSSAFRYPLCQDGDRSSLLQLKRSFVFDEIDCDPSSYNYTKLASWKLGENCCSWDGVYCEAKTGHVIGLDLSSSCLYGSINSSSPLFRLVNLKSLDLSYNNFNLSAIPGAIRSLSQLKHLNLTYSHFIGQIPSGILELSYLVSLRLSLNPLVLEKPSLKDVVESYAHLEELHLTGVTISSHVPQSLLNLTSLSSLLLRNCSLSGQFPPGVFRLPNLVILDLRSNPNLTGYLPEFDNVSSPLEEVWLDGTSFSGQLPDSVGNLKSLRVFSAEECRLGGVIPSSAGNLSNLDTLVLSRNYFSGKIPSTLGNMFRLTFMDLSYNNFSSGTLNWVGTLANLETLVMQRTNTFGAIPSSLGNLTQLIGFGIDENQLTGPLPSWIGNFTQLTQLSISDNELQGPIPESIFRLPNIQLLNLPRNNLSGSLKYDSFLQMQHISRLQLSYNQLSLVSSPYSNVTLPKFQLLGLGGCNLREFPTFLRGQIQLEFLNLCCNSIEGYVPTWLFALESLTYLSLANNYLIRFEQPLSILSLPNLNTFELNSNQFEGPLPLPSLSMVIYDVSRNKFSGHVSPLFCNLSSALSLDFSSNNLGGTLPPCLGNIALVLNLKNNSFSGAIPNKFSSGCKLKYMDFGQNLFEGKVPNSLAKCSDLEILKLDENRMNDSFPSWLGILPHLRVLSLRSNRFQGTIAKPLTKFEFRRLQIIDLSCNKFIGKLPLEYFRNWVSMTDVDKGHLAYMQADTSFDISLITITLSQ